MRKRIETVISVLFLALVLFIVFVAITRGQTAEIVASGGQFTLEKQVVAGGGNQMSQAVMNQSGTGGQTIAGISSNGGNFSVYSGFWTPDGFTPTAATAVVGGRIRTADGRGIRNVLITITYPDGQTRTTISSAFGYYRFADIPVGATYIFSIQAKKFSFTPPTQVRTILEDLQDIDFTAEAVGLNAETRPK